MVPYDQHPDDPRRPDGPAPDGWVDDQLRRVPIPHGLLLRLRQIAVAGDAQFDAALRQVPVPAGLLARLHEIPAACPPLSKALRDDATLDAAVAGVSPPAGMSARLRAIPAETAADWSDARIDRELRDVPVPVELAARLVAIPDLPMPARRPFDRRQRQMSWSRLALALSLVFVITLSYAGAIGSFVITAYRGGPGTEPVVTLDSPMLAQRESAVLDDAQRGFEILPAPDTVSIDQPAASLVAEPAVPEVMQAGQQVGTESAPYLADLAWPVPGTQPPFDPLLNVVELNNPPIANVVSAALPPLHLVADRPARGIAPPRADADALLFEIRHGVHAFRSPAAHQSLHNVTVPLGAGTAGFEHAWSVLEQGELPSPSAIHVEDFLRALDYRFAPAPVGRLALRTAAGVSPFESDGLALLQVAVQAGEMEPSAEPRVPVSLTVAVDTSAGMDRHLGLSHVRRALLRLLDDLKPEDRFSLIVFDEDDYLQLRDVPVADRDLLESRIRAIAAAQSTNFGEGLRQACAVARESVLPVEGRRRLVLLTDGLTELPPASQRQVERNFEAAAADRVEVEIINLGPETVRSTLLDRLASSGAARLTRAAGAEEAAWALRESLTGRSQVVARNARLTVRFDPEAVESYRLTGHETANVVGVNTAPLEIDLRAGQSGSALFELYLKPGAGNHVAWAEVSWYSPESGAEHALRQRITRLQFAPSFLESHPSLQQAAVAAATAEWLQQNYYTRLRGIRQEGLLRAADQIPPERAAEDSFDRLLRMIRMAGRQGLR